MVHGNDFVLNCDISIAKALEILQSCTVIYEWNNAEEMSMQCMATGVLVFCPDHQYLLILQVTGVPCDWFQVIWVRSWNCGCLVTWFCYQLIAKPGNKTATVPWPDPYVLVNTDQVNECIMTCPNNQNGGLRQYRCKSSVQNVFNLYLWLPVRKTIILWFFYT